MHISRLPVRLDCLTHFRFIKRLVSCRRPGRPSTCLPDVFASALSVQETVVSMLSASDRAGQASLLNRNTASIHCKYKYINHVKPRSSGDLGSLRCSATNFVSKGKSAMEMIFKAHFCSSDSLSRHIPGDSGLQTDLNGSPSRCLEGSHAHQLPDQCSSRDLQRREQRRTSRPIMSYCLAVLQRELAESR